MPQASQPTPLTLTIKPPPLPQPLHPLSPTQPPRLSTQISDTQLISLLDIPRRAEHPLSTHPPLRDIGVAAVVEVASGGPHTIAKELGPIILETADTEAVV